MLVIYLTAYGRTGLRHLLIGSVAECAVRYAACSVLVVPSFSPARKELMTKTARRQGKQRLESALKTK
jgi:hypothetical protein